MLDMSSIINKTRNEVKDMNIKKLGIVAIVLLSLVIPAFALSSYLDSFNAKYKTTGTKLDTCILCHTSSSGGARNSYGIDFGNNAHNFTTIEPKDSDKDTFTNIIEIRQRTFPGNALSHPNYSMIDGWKFNDSNGNRIKDIGEKGIPNWNITLKGVDLVRRTLVTRTVRTNATGYFVFKNVTNGVYVLSEEFKLVWIPTTDGAYTIRIPATSTNVRKMFGNKKV